jgi:hypothetical protein
MYSNDNSKDFDKYYRCTHNTEYAYVIDLDFFFAFMRIWADSTYQIFEFRTLAENCESST